MLKLTRKTEYALLALGHLCHDDGGSATKVREIANTYNIPFPVLAKVMQQLARHNFVEPIKGAQGGYRLKVDPVEIDLWQFLEEMEGRSAIVGCFVDEACDQLPTCMIRSPLHIIDDTIKSVFHGMTLKDVIRPAVPFRGLASATGTPSTSTTEIQA
ncbi:MAG: Rrf2 family transcriptional regulator [Candidatus Marinimicrobia bacterium]|nr:Rrf2 family transcriptional regulator [Candidatus Neomarinimicrobiota bacterium]